MPTYEYWQEPGETTIISTASDYYSIFMGLIAPDKKCVGTIEAESFESAVAQINAWRAENEPDFTPDFDYSNDEYFKKPILITKSKSKSKRRKRGSK